MKHLIFVFALAVMAFSWAGAAEQEPVFVSLFDGKTFNGWTTVDGKPVTKGWEVTPEGWIHRAGAGGDIYTEKEYANFILEFEWKVAPKANSGVKYRMARYGNSYLGPEYQVIDDGNKKPDRFSAGSLYELFPPAPDRRLNPPGEWNQSRIVAGGTKIEHWLNGQKVVEADTSTEAFRKAVAASKFRNQKDFAQNPSGRIMLQDHGGEVWFRSLRIKVLP